MRVVCSFVVCGFFLLLVSCQSSPQIMAREASAAANAQEVADAWDLNCGQCNFYECPPDIFETLQGPTLEEMYFGGQFESDCESLMIKIQTEVNSSVYDKPDIDDELREVLEDPVWFE